MLGPACARHLLEEGGEHHCLPLGLVESVDERVGIAKVDVPEFCIEHAPTLAIDLNREALVPLDVQPAALAPLNLAEEHLAVGPHPVLAPLAQVEALVVADIHNLDTTENALLLRGHKDER